MSPFIKARCENAALAKITPVNGVFLTARQACRGFDAWHE
jgi:hypothetical protein